VNPEIERQREKDNKDFELITQGLNHAMKEKDDEKA